MTGNYRSFSESVLSLRWAEMVRISRHVAQYIDNNRDAGFDKNEAVAKALHDLAEEIADECEKTDAATRTEGDSE